MLLLIHCFNFSVLRFYFAKSFASAFYVKQLKKFENLVYNKNILIAMLNISLLLVANNVSNLQLSSIKQCLQLQAYTHSNAKYFPD